MENNIFRNAIFHTKSILLHKKYVMYYCCKVGLFWQGVSHDLSKFSITEFIPGVKYYNGKCSPNSLQKKKEGFSSSWLHHKNSNKHHYEYWLDYSDHKYNETGEKISAIKMPNKYLVEMFCDRVAACRVYRGNSFSNSDPLNYYLERRECMIIHDKTRKDLEKLLKILAVYGEDKAFRYARYLLNSDR